MNHKIRRGPVVGNRNIVHLGDPKERLHIGIMGRRCQRIRKEYHKIHLSLYNLGPYLLVAPQRTAVVALNRQPCAFSDHAGRSACAA